MCKTSPFAAAALAAALLGPVVAPAATRTAAVPEPAASTARPIKGPSTAASANRELARDGVPSVRDEPASAPTSTAAAARAQLKAGRENLKEGDAARELARQQKPSTYDRDIQMGDKDHTEQVTELKAYLKK